MKNSTIAIILILFAFQVQSDENHADKSDSRDKRKFPVIRQEDFKPYMLGHIHEGCPSNSTCSKETGLSRKKWVDVLKAAPNDKKKAARGIERFRKTYGIPLSFWVYVTSKPDTEPKHKLIIWDSHCPNHQAKDNNKQINLGETLTKDFKSLLNYKNDQHKIMVSKTFTLNNNGKVESYPHPRADFPTFMDSTGIYFTREEEGKYYGMRVSKAGLVNIIPITSPKSFPQEVKCPDPLTKVFDDYIQMNNLYMGRYCKALWNRSSKKFQTFIFGWSCN